MKQDFQLLDRLRNKKRKLMLIAIYKKSRHYSELTELTGLKPGSIYHHLKVLEPLVRKESQGLYEITEEGKKLVENNGLVEIEVQKPTVKTTKIEYDRNEDVLHSIWLGKLNKALLIFVVSVVILLAFNGVALAGSAIYVLDSWSVIIFDFVAIGLGWGALYLLEIITHNKLYKDIWFTLTIRLLSMLPGSIIGLGLFLLFLIGVYPSDLVFIILFVLSTLGGLLTAATGEYYLRLKASHTAIRVAAIPFIIDILLGGVVLVSSL